MQRTRSSVAARRGAALALVAMTLLAAGLLGGCGQKGALMLPAPAPPPAAAASVPAA